MDGGAPVFFPNLRIAVRWGSDTWGATCAAYKEAFFSFVGRYANQYMGAQLCLLGSSSSAVDAGRR